MIFRDRIVLKDGTVIMPENIDRVEVVGRGRSTIVSYDVERKNTYSVIAEEGMFRTDRPTGMVDSKKMMIFDGDTLSSEHGDITGHVAYYNCAFHLILDKPFNGSDSMLLFFLGNFTITGMVPFGEET